MRGAGTDGRDGTGLDQLQQAAAAAGFSARVVQIDTALLLQQLAKSDVPVLVLVFVPDGHFVDVVGRAGDNLLVSDPDSGSKAMTVGDFTKIWRGDALIVNPKS
jgi:ABC-type bacteriocin/lantibiotic exporter with double-glycine peptidase domain